MKLCNFITLSICMVLSVTTILGVVLVGFRLIPHEALDTLKYVYLIGMYGIFLMSFFVILIQLSRFFRGAEDDE